MNCKQCGEPVEREQKFCENCGAAVEHSSKKRPVLWIVLAIVVVLAAVVVVYLNSQKNADQTTEAPSDEVILPSVKPTGPGIQVKELENRSFYTAEFTVGGERAIVYVLPSESGEETQVAEGEQSFVGDAGDSIYNGSLEFYLADATQLEGYLQDVESGEYMLNLTNEPFSVQEIAEQSILYVTEAMSSSHWELEFWTVKEGKLTLMPVEGQPRLTTSTNQLKVVEDRFIQTYSYLNDEPSGWIFKTYEWDSENDSFSLFDENDLLVEGPFIYDEMEQDVRDFYQSMVDNWSEMEDYHLPFPYKHYPEDLADRFRQGYILDDQAPIGSSVEKLLERKPDYLGVYDTEGAWLYAYPDGQSIIFDYNSDDIIGVQLSGANYIESVEDVRALLGEPLYDSMDEKNEDVPEGYDDAMNYEYGEYSLRVEYNGDRVNAFVLLNKAD